MVVGSRGLKLRLYGFPARIQKPLQNQNRGYLVDQGLVLLAAFACGIENFMRGPAGQALVDEIDGQTGQFSQFVSKCTGLDSLGADFAGARFIEVQRVAGYDACAVVSPAEAGERAHVVAGITLTGEREYGLGEEAELIGDGDADAFRADVETEVARDGSN